MISGEPGVGKTRLANELMAHASLNGGLVLQGGCYEYEATTPYLPLAEALRDWAHAQSDDVLRERLGPSAAELAKHHTYSIKRARSDLGYDPKIGLDEGLRRFYEWALRENLDWRP